jgi:hypothetical protein
MRAHQQDAAESDAACVRIPAVSTAAAASCAEKHAGKAVCLVRAAGTASGIAARPYMLAVRAAAAA